VREFSDFRQVMMCLLPPMGDVGSGGQGVGVVGAQDSQPVGEQLLQGGERASRIPRLPRHRAMWDRVVRVLWSGRCGC
jgi:hypothetical protein